MVDRIKQDPTPPAVGESVPGVAPEPTKVDEGPKVTIETDGHAIHSTGPLPDGGDKPEDVQARIREGIPETPKPAAGTVLYETPGGYQVAPAGVDVEQVGSNAVGRV